MTAIDFTPILTLLILVIPVILIIAILKKFLSGKIFVLASVGLMFALLFSGIFMPLGMVGMTRAAGSLSPDSGTVMTDIPNYFTADGLTASTAYWVNVTVGGSVSNAAILTSDSSGTLSFSLTFTTEGSTLVEVKVKAGTLACSGTFNVVNFINLLMPYIILAVTLSILFGVIGMISGLTSRRR